MDRDSKPVSVPEALRRLSDEEAARVEPLSDSAVETALREGERAKQAFRTDSGQQGLLTPSLRFQHGR